MKRRQKKKVTLNKFQVARLNNLRVIVGGSDGSSRPTQRPKTEDCNNP